MKITIPYKPRTLQKEIHKNRGRMSVIVCHRRFGKTVLAINELIKTALTCQHPQPRCAYIAPLYRQAKAVAWDYAKHYTRPIPGVSYNEAELRVDLPTGGRVQLLGAGEQVDSLRGIYLDGVVLDEYAQMSPRAWGEIIRPALSDRQGWAMFIGTPLGHNQFYELYERADELPGWSRAMYKASETGLILQEELDAARREMTEEEYLQEYECSWAAAIKGAYYGKEMAKARIANVPYDKALPVETWWDLGVGDSNVIWFAQRHGPEVRLIDYYEMSGEGLAHYAKVLQDRGYVYSRHIAPHDIEVRELGSGKSRKEMAAALGIRFEVAPKLSVMDGINAVRAMLPLCWFDKHKCRQGIEALKQYRTEYDDRLKVFKSSPLHDWSSHAADAFRYGAISRQQAGGWNERIEYSEAGII